MSSLFGRKGADSSAERRQIIKKYLNKELSLNIKKLQKDHISSASAIRSGETVNRICSCLEAIFLHELKDSYSSKTFWPFVTKFTHRDVLEQIKQLLFIRTEIGKCRAWIRMAVNDCLMDSYLSAILREPSTLKQYYKPGAFLRDSELPPITNDFLQGLTVFTFQLSCNSSVLNMWDTALLLLSGANISKEKESADASTTSTVSKKISNTSFHEPEMSPSLLVEDTPGAQGTVTTFDVGSPVKVRELEDSLVIDFVETAPDDPSTDLAQKLEEESETDLEQTSKPPSGSDNSSAIPNVERVEGQDYQELKQPPESLNPFLSSSSVQEDGELVLSRQKTNTGKGKRKKKSKKEVEAVISPELGGSVGNTSEAEGVGSDRTTVGDTKEVPKDEFRKPKLSHPPKDALNHASKVVAEKGKTASGESEGRSQNDDEDLYQVWTDSNPFEDDGEGLDPHARNGVDDAMTGEAREGQLGESNVHGSAGDVLRGDGGVPVQEEEEETGPWDVERVRTKEEIFEGSFGNSLTAMQGWSSDFERLSAPDPTAEKNMVESQESYSTMVGKYIQNTAPSISVPESLIQSDETERAPEGNEIKQETMGEDAPEMIEDFEVIPVTNGPLSKYADDRTQELLDMVTKIGLEKGLDAQKFQCRGCSCELGIIFGKHRVCNYNGYYYCSECHLDEQAVIPARILYNWDFRKHPVACHTKLFLNQIEDMSLIDVGKCNPTLYSAVSEMEQILELRKQLVYLKAYLFTCKESVAEELRSKIWPRDYMLENYHLYSVKDFLQVQNGSLGPQLKKVIVFAAKHVQQCALCSQKGFICEICENPKIIYPFDTELTVRCEKCRSVYHKACKTDIKPCPRCLRRKVKSPEDEGAGERTQFPSPFT